MNNMKDAFGEALKKRSQNAPTLNIKIEVEGADQKDEMRENGMAPSKLPPGSPHEDEAQDEALIDKKLAEAGLNDNDMAEEVQEEMGDPEMDKLLGDRAAMQTREPKTLSERAAAEFAKKKKA